MSIDDDFRYQQFGLYRPRYKMAHSDEYKAKLDEIRDLQKDLIKNGKAIIGNTDWTVSGSAAKGKKMVKDMQKLLLRAFNSECDELVDKVKYNNYDVSLRRINASCDAISNLGNVMGISISNFYKNAKVSELTLAFEYAQKKQEEKEAEKETRARLREEAKLQKEIKMIDGKVVQERPRNNAYLLCDGLHEAIIPDTVFQSAANKMQKNKIRPVRGDKKPNNPLASLVICQKCGRRMQRRPNVKTPDLLICAEPTCQNHASYIHLVEKHILIILRQWANGFSITGQNTVLVIPQTEDLSTGLAALQKSEMTVRAQLDKAFEAFETGIYDADTFRSRSGLLKDKLAEICRKSTELQERINKAEENKKIITEFIPKVKRFVDVYETVSDPAIKNHMLKEIIDHIDYNKEVRGHGHEENFYITVYPRLPAL